MIVLRIISFVAIVSIVQCFSTTGSLALFSVGQSRSFENFLLACLGRCKRVGSALISMGASSNEGEIFPRLNKLRALPSAKISLEVAFKEVGRSGCSQNEHSCSRRTAEGTRARVEIRIDLLPYARRLDINSPTRSLARNRCRGTASGSARRPPSCRCAPSTAPIRASCAASCRCHILIRLFPPPRPMCTLRSIVAARPCAPPAGCDTDRLDSAGPIRFPEMAVTALPWR
jgi:hypothetical protein